MSTITIEVNGKALEARTGETILATLNRHGIKVPTLCHMEDLFPTGACRMCVVEIEGQRGLTPSCAYPVAEGMTIRTHSPRVLRARKTIVELLLSTHPDDCLYCVRNGECELQALAEELGVRERRYSGEVPCYHVDNSSVSVVRDPAKCILCGRCVRVCEEVQGVSALDFTGRGSSTIVSTAFKQGLNVSSCINCGQCVMVCPTGALREQSDIKEVVNALDDPDRFVVVQHAPAVSVSLAEEFGTKPGQDINGIMTAALRRIGFDRVFETSFTADLTIMEEASELAHRIRTGGTLPMMTSCSPGWIKYVEQFFPEQIAHLSSCKSPQQMLGAVIKQTLPGMEGIDGDKVFSVSIMPCTAKKFEARRNEMSRDGNPDIDAVLTTRELARVLRQRGIDLQALTPESADSPFGKRSSAGKLFGASGGVMEAAARTAYYLLSGEDMTDPKITVLRGSKGVKEATVTIGELALNVAVVSGLLNAKRLLEEIRDGRSKYHFIEVMTCPGGCVAGGGQPRQQDPQAIQKRMQALYDIDRDEAIRFSHHNPEIKRLYSELLDEPLSKKSHDLLHTHYAMRKAVL